MSDVQITPEVHEGQVYATVEPVEPELSWSDRMFQQVRQLDATALAKSAVQDAAAAKADEEVDLDEMNVVPNRKAQRDAANLRGSIRLNRSRVRRRIHRVLTKRGFWA